MEKEPATKSKAKRKKRGLPKHLEKHKIKKGQVLNPTGRPKKIKELTVRCRNMTEDILNVLHSILMDKEHRGGDRIRAGELILAYGYGKPQQTVTLDDQTERKQVSITLKVDGNEETITAEGDKLLT